MKPKTSTVISPSDIEPNKLSEFFDGKIESIVSGKMDNRKLKKLVIEYTGGKLADLTQKNGYKHKDVQEALERSIIKHARTLMTQDIDANYNALRNLYNNQPLLNARTGGSMARQAYSTPMHYAYLANLYSMANNPDAKVYEPTAGHGALALGSNPANVYANELDAFRTETLNQLGFNVVTSEDASKQLYDESFDSAVMNPPFGSIKAVDVNGANIRKLEHVISLNALQSVKKDGGRAAIIIGGSPEGKVSVNDKVFLNQIRKKFNVERYFNIDGKEYTRQGTSFPTVMIIVGPKTDKSPDIDLDKVWSVDEVYEQFKEDKENGLLARPKNYEHSRSVSSFDGGDIQGQVPTDVDVRGQSSNESSGQSKPDGRLGSNDNGDTGLRSDTDGRVQTGDNDTRGSGGSDIKPTESTPANRSDGSVPKGQSATQADSQGSTVSADQANNSRPIDTGKQKRRTDVVEKSGDFQSSYDSQSAGKSVGTVIPNNQLGPIREALLALESKVGNLDVFVKDKLGYPNTKQLYKAFSGEQIDALALGIHNNNNGKSLIIGDQTGVGKGRVGAGMLRYAMKEGMKPIFVTEKPALFSDMFRDLNDISLKGEALPVPFIVNGADQKDARITDPRDKDKVFFRQTKKQVDDITKAMKKGDYSFDKDSDFIMTTYSQFLKVSMHKVQYLTNRAEKNFVILDESHNAAGQSFRGEVTKNMLDVTAGAVYLSATYAKTPSNMGVYDRTVIGRSGLSVDELADALGSGGNPLLEYVSEALVLSGEYVRREKSFEGVETNIVDVPTTEKQKGEYDNIVSFYRELIRVDEMLGPEIVSIATEKEPEAMNAQASGNASSTIEAGNFSSTVHNNISQLLLALKVKETIKDTVNQIKLGNKVVITLANTMESHLPKPGQVIGVDFRATLDRAITNILKASYKDGDGKASKIEIEDSELSQDSQKLIARLRKEVRDLTIKLPASPIDAIVQGVEDAGYSITELTGRSRTVGRSGEVVSRPRPGTASVIDEFNNGDLNAIIANEVIATGFSLHASETYSRQEKRVMILAQAHLDINKVMQMLGRVNRTGQVTKPEYRYIRTDLPAEIRPFTVFMQKMKSLNANTSANSDSETSLQVEDILNKYGDNIVSDYMSENKELASSVNLTSVDKDGKITQPPVAGFAKKATGRLALATVKDQSEFWEYAVPAYKQRIEELNAVGENDIDSQFLDFQAEKISEELIFGGDTENPLTGPVRAGVYKVRVLAKPFKKAEILAMSEKNKNSAKELLTAIREKTPAYLAEIKADPDKEEFYGRTLERVKKIINQIENLKIGKYYSWYDNGDITSGVLTDVRYNKKADDPSKPSAIKLVLAVNSGVKRLIRPLTQLNTLELGGYGRNTGLIPSNWDSKAGESFLERTIVTGNILKGYSFASGGNKSKGKSSIITFSTSDGEIKRGVLLPKGKLINADSVTSMPVNESDLRKLLDAGNKKFTSDQMDIREDGDSWKVSFPVKGNKKLVTDQSLNEIEVTGDFQKNDRDGTYQGYVKIDDIIKFISLKGRGFEIARTKLNLDLITPEEPSIKPKPSTGKTFNRSESYSDMSGRDKAKARQIVKKMTGTANVEFAKKLFSSEGKEVFGKYSSELIEISEGKGDFDNTARHEAMHQVYDKLLTTLEKDVFDNATDRLGLSHEQAIEKVNEFASTQKGVTGMLKSMAKRMIRRLKKIFGAESLIDQMNDIYDRSLSGELAERGETGTSNYEGDHKLFRSKEELKKAVAKDSSRVDLAWDSARNFYGQLKDDFKTPRKKKDLFFFDRAIRTISHFSERVPALKRIFDISMRLRDDKHLLENSMFNEDGGDGLSNFDQITKYAKDNKKEWKKLQQHLLQKDVDQNGYRVVEAGGSYNLYNSSNQFFKKFDSEDQAWFSAYALEARDMRVTKDWSEGAIQTTANFRRIYDRQFKQLRGNVEEYKKNSEKYGLKDIQIGDTTLFNLFEEMKKMGDIRGSYMARIRTGQYLLWAKKGEEKRLEMFDSVLGLGLRKRKLRKEGWSVESSKSNQPSQDAFIQGGNIAAMNDLIENALQRVEGNIVDISQFNINSEVVGYKDSAGKNRNDLLLKGDNIGRFALILTSFGGKKDGNTWAFKNIGKNKIDIVQKAIATAISHHQGTQQIETSVVGQALAEQMAIMFHAKGSGARKIARDGRKGEEVYKGYEEDALKAISMSVRSTAGGAAKRAMAKNMIDAFTGRDLRWEEYVKDNMDSSLDDNSVEFYESRAGLWQDYKKDVDERRIDSSQQPIAFKEGLEYMTEMTRNDTSSERVIGKFRAFAALKYLSGFSGGLVNLTALGTTVPAAMSHFAGIDLNRTPRLLMAGVRDYVKYMKYHKYGKGSDLTGEKKFLFDEIAKRGWDTPLMNEEAVNVTRTFGGNVWNTIVEKGLIVFSVTERLNRAATIAAAYNGLVKNNEGDLTNDKREELLQLAKRVADKAHGVYGKENMPSWARGSGFGQVGRAAYMFQTFVHNYFQVISGMVSKKDYKSLGFIMLAPGVLAGIGASPLGLLAGAIAKVIPGFEEPEDMEEALALFVEEYAGEYAGGLARFGIAGKAGLSLKGSLAIRTELPTTIEDLLGASFSATSDVISGIGKVASGDVYKGFEEGLPRVVSTVMKGYREGTEGVTNSRNQPVFYGDEALKASTSEAWLRVFGFNPIGIAEKRERQWKDYKIEKKYRSEKASIYTDIRRFLLNGGTKSDWMEHLKVIENYNAKAIRTGNTNIPRITPRSIQGVINAMDKGPRRESLRAKEQSSTEKADLELPNFDGFTPTMNSESSRARRSSRPERRRRER